jgi:glutamate synthase (NADPH/NADH) small chain
MHGHDVVIFEAREKAGGLNEYGIAKYKLVDDFAQKELEFLLQIGGIEIRHGQKLGDNLSLTNCISSSTRCSSASAWPPANSWAWPTKRPGLLAATDYIRELRQADDLTNCPGRPLHRDRRRQHRHRHGRADGPPRRPRRQPGVPPGRGHGRHRTMNRTSPRPIRRLLTWAQPEEVLLDANGQVRGMRFARTHWSKASSTGETFELAADAIFKAIGQASTAAPSPTRWPANSSARAIASKSMSTCAPASPACMPAATAPASTRTSPCKVQHGKLAAEAINAQLMLNVEAA